MAEHCGFGSAQSLRVHFTRIDQITPTGTGERSTLRDELRYASVHGQRMDLWRMPARLTQVPSFAMSGSRS